MSTIPNKQTNSNLELDFEKIEKHKWLFHQISLGQSVAKQIRIHYSDALTYGIKFNLVFWKKVLGQKHPKRYVIPSVHSYCKPGMVVDKHDQ